MRRLVARLAGWKGYAAAIAIGAAIAGPAAWTVNGWRLTARHTSVLEDLAYGTVAATQAARAEEQRRTAAVEEQRDIAERQAKALESDVAAGRATAGRLRNELNALRARGCAGSATAADGSTSQPGADPIGMLIDMLEGMESSGRKVAEYADRLKIAGEACEAGYAALSSMKPL